MIYVYSLFFKIFLRVRMARCSMVFETMRPLFQVVSRQSMRIADLLGSLLDTKMPRTHVCILSSTAMRRRNIADRNKWLE
jgi:hypothetical protein